MTVIHPHVVVQRADCRSCGHVFFDKGLSWDGESFSAECVCGGLID